MYHITITGVPLARRARPRQIRLLQHSGALPLPMVPHSILQNSVKTAGLPVLLPMAPLHYKPLWLAQELEMMLKNLKNLHFD